MQLKNILLLSCLLLCLQAIKAQPIDRKKLVERHTVVNKNFDSLSSLTVGNGRFAFTVDATGLQSFPDFYARGVPLGTQSEWGWHSFPNTENYIFDETLKDYKLNGRNVSYSVQLKEPERSKNAVEYFRQNPHRLQLGNIGLEIEMKDGTLAHIKDITNIRQTLNMWSGEIHSMFNVEGTPVDLITYCYQDADIIAFKIKSDLIKESRIAIRFCFPYPGGEWKDVGNNHDNNEKHLSSLAQPSASTAVLIHQIDTTKYSLDLSWTGFAHIKQAEEHVYKLTPSGKTEFELSCEFAPRIKKIDIPRFEEVKTNSEKHWMEFWQSGGAVDFSGSTDKRAFELERRIILSQYLTRVQCAGYYPPQETGLTYNSWYGKPHLEMHWWHGIHFALWGRTALLEKSLEWYIKVYDKAEKIARRQGYEGVRWQKMTDNEGDESPSSVGAFLIWQQPHIIYFAELAYRDHPNSQTLDKYKKLVFATADFMASYAYYDPTKQRYILGKGVIAAQERFKAEQTFNPTYELVYWHWALNLAQKWRERLHLPRNEKWDKVLKNLLPLPVQENKYLFTESAVDSYTNPEYKTDHPSVLGALGMLPKTAQLDTAIMKNTFEWIWKNWSWKDTWGWDFPMTAMTATRLGMPDKAIDALLMPVQTNTYLNNGHNYQDNRLTIYLPGNGGLLAAIAVMCAGYEGSKVVNPGIPKDGKWRVRWEGLKKMF
jgi:hypothetical protein